MATFFKKDRERKRGLLALLLAFLRFNKRRSGLILVAVLLGGFFLFGAASRLIFWSASRAGGSSGADGLDGGTRGSWSEELAKAFRSARSIQNGEATLSGVLMNRGSSASLPVQSSLPQNRFDIPQSKTVKGIAEPDAEGNLSRGVEIKSGDMQGERQDVADQMLPDGAGGGRPGFSGGMGQGAFGGQSGGSDPLGDSSAYAPTNLFNGTIGAWTQGRQDLALQGAGKAPSAPTRSAGVRGGPLSGMARQLAFKGKGFGVNPNLLKGVPFQELSWAYANDKVSAAPACTDFNGCPQEVAAVGTGVVYDGSNLPLGGNGSSYLPNPQNIASGGAPVIQTWSGGSGTPDPTKITSDQNQCLAARLRDDNYAHQFSDIVNKAASMLNANYNCAAPACNVRYQLYWCFNIWNNTKIAQCTALTQLETAACSGQNTMLTDEAAACAAQDQDTRNIGIPEQTVPTNSNTGQPVGLQSCNYSFTPNSGDCSTWGANTFCGLKHDGSGDLNSDVQSLENQYNTLKQEADSLSTSGQTAQQGP